MYCRGIHRRTEKYTVEDIVYSVIHRTIGKISRKGRYTSWKANSPILNLLLPILNEREFVNDGKKFKVPLMTAFASSNEFPEDRESLAAIYDRFVLRMQIDSIKDNKNIDRMMMDRVLKNNKSKLNTEPTVLSIDEIEALNNASMSVKVNANIIKTLIKIQNAAAKKGGVFISDRKKNQCIDIVQAYALYNGRGHVSTDDLLILKYVFFDEDVPMDEIEAEILKLVDPYTDEIKKHYRQYKEIREKIDAETDPGERLKSIVEGDKALQQIISNIANAIQKAQKNGKDATEFFAKRDEISEYRRNMISSALGGTASIPNNPIDFINDTSSTNVSVGQDFITTSNSTTNY